MKVSEPFLSRCPWAAAILVASVATPAAVVLAWLLPRPLDAVAALPLVLIDVWASRAASSAQGDESGRAALVRLLLLALGMVLTWIFYVIVARLMLWRMLRRNHSL